MKNKKAADKKLLLTKIEAAERDVSEAEEHLGKVVRATARVKRAEKMTVSEVLELAIVRLRSARADLHDLAKILSKHRLDD